MKVVGYVAVFFGGIVACYLFVSLGVLDAVDGVPGTQSEPSLSLPTYLSFVGVMMTAVTTVLAAVAIGIGVIAAYTFREIKDEAQKTASMTAKDVSAEALSEVKVKSMVFELYAKAEKERENQIEWGDDPSDSEER